MSFKLKLWLLILNSLSFLVLNASGDLEPNIQDKRTVILNMDFHGKSSSRSRSSVSESELSEYSSHLILALQSTEYLKSSYNIYIAAMHKV